MIVSLADCYGFPLGVYSETVVDVVDAIFYPDAAVAAHFTNSLDCFFYKIPTTEIAICAVIPVALSRNNKTPISSIIGAKIKSFSITVFSISYFSSFFFPSLSSPKNKKPTTTNATERIPIHISTPPTPCVNLESELAFPASAGGFFTTVPPGKPNFLLELGL